MLSGAAKKACYGVENGFGCRIDDGNFVIDLREVAVGDDKIGTEHSQSEKISFCAKGPKCRFVVSHLELAGLVRSISYLRLPWVHLSAFGVFDLLFRPY